jgi:hypothetical protein
MTGPEASRAGHSSDLSHRIAANATLWFNSLLQSYGSFLPGVDPRVSMGSHSTGPAVLAGKIAPTGRTPSPGRMLESLYPELSGARTIAWRSAVSPGLSNIRRRISGFVDCPTLLAPLSALSQRRRRRLRLGGSLTPARIPVAPTAPQPPRMPHDHCRWPSRCAWWARLDRLAPSAWRRAQRGRVPDPVPEPVGTWALRDAPDPEASVNSAACRHGRTVAPSKRCSMRTAALIRGKMIASLNLHPRSSKP